MAGGGPGKPFFKDDELAVATSLPASVRRAFSSLPRRRHTLCSESRPALPFGSVFLFGNPRRLLARQLCWLHALRYRMPDEKETAGENSLIVVTEKSPEFSACVSNRISYAVSMYELALVACIFLAALLYSSVGHGGGSGYLAAMAFFSVAPQSMRPAALFLNILVASIGTFRFYRAGCFSWSLFWPFALASIPCAFLGGTQTLPSSLYKQVVGAVLLFAAVRLLRKPVAEVSRHVAVPLRATLRCRDRTALRPDGNGRRHFPQPAAAAHRLGQHPHHRRSVGRVHSGQFDRRHHWTFEPRSPVAGSASLLDGRGHRRRADWRRVGKQAARQPDVSQVDGAGAGDRRLQANPVLTPSCVRGDFPTRANRCVAKSVKWRQAIVPAESRLWAPKVDRDRSLPAVWFPIRLVQ